MTYYELGAAKVFAPGTFFSARLLRAPESRLLENVWNRSDAPDLPAAASVSSIDLPSPAHGSAGPIARRLVGSRRRRRGDRHERLRTNQECDSGCASWLSSARGSCSPSAERRRAVGDRGLPWGCGCGLDCRAVQRSRRDLVERAPRSPHGDFHSLAVKRDGTVASRRGCVVATSGNAASPGTWLSERDRRIAAGSAITASR